MQAFHFKSLSKLSTFHGEEYVPTRVTSTTSFVISFHPCCSTVCLKHWLVRGLLLCALEVVVVSFPHKQWYFLPDLCELIHFFFIKHIFWLISQLHLLPFLSLILFFSLFLFSLYHFPKKQDMFLKSFPY